VSGNDLRCGTCGTDHHPAEECDCLDCGVCASCVERSRAHHGAMTAPTPADAARWLRENKLGYEGYQEGLRYIIAESYAAYAAHVLGRVEVCGECWGTGKQDANPHTTDPTQTDCPRCAGRGWTLTEAT